MNSVLNRYWLLTTLTLIYAVTFSGRQIMAVMVEAIKTEYGVSDAVMGSLVGLIYALLIPMLAGGFGLLVLMRTSVIFRSETLNRLMVK